MAKSLLSAVLSVLFEKLSSPELLEFATLEGVRSELKIWANHLRTINALLPDAEEKQLGYGAVKMWLEELQDLAYDVEDILDEYGTEVLSRHLKFEKYQGSTSTARKLIPACCISSIPHDLWSDFGMRSKIYGITSRLEDLYSKHTALGLVEIPGRRLTGLQRPPTTSSQMETVVYGRDEDKAKILEMVLSDEPGDANHGVISIVGMGGLGKTTLAQLVYNDEATTDFDPKGWVCVSDEFDVTKISIAILESITKCNTDLVNLYAVQNQLKQKLAGRKFLLVLDDVWNDDYSKWEMLRSPFMVGARGSKIIVTTRLEYVALTMGHSNGCYTLPALSDDDCWSLFKKLAIDNEVLSSHAVELIRQKVVEKCQGLPVVARTLGGLLRSEERDEWLGMLNSRMSELWYISEFHTALQISYYHLPSHLKRCFAYCGIFPKDYQFEENELVLLWMAEGLIQPSKTNKDLEELGGEYFHDLLSRSIFQISCYSSSKFIMHGLVNDLAQMVSGKLSFRLEGELESSDQLRISEMTRYASYTCHEYNLKRRFEVFNDAVHLRTHLSMPQINDRVETCYISNMVISDLFRRFKKLRVLSLKNYYITELPDSIKGLRHLRYLNLSGTKIKWLPESVKSLCNLQTLILRNCCEFLKWPSDMGNLINLRHIDILGATSISHMPMGVKKWKKLRTLSNFILSNDSRSSLKDLRHLMLLCGELHISNLENMIVLENTIESILHDKQYLKVLLLEWGSRFEESQDEAIESRDEEMDKKILDTLQPHRNLEKLTIRCYRGKIFSSWVGNSLFSKMTVIKLEDCNKCTSLPSFGLLDSLKSLIINGMKGLKNIDSTFYGQHCSNPFRSLETLCFENLEECESWDLVKENDNFPKLQELSIVNCPKLSKRLPNKLSSLKKLIIRGCEQLVVSLSNIPKLYELELHKCKKIVCTSSAFLESLEYMTLSNISDFGDMLTQELQKVQNLKIVGCKELIELWQNEIFLEKPHQGLHSLNSLKKLDFNNCHTLTTLLEGIKQKHMLVEELRIESCDSLNFIFRGQLPRSLKKLHIGKCETLQCLLGDNEDTSTELSSATFLPYNTFHLESLEINSCPSLTSLPLIHQLSTTLTSLFIFDCSKLLTCHLPEALKHLEIGNCSNLTTLSPTSHLPKSLETLTICDCPQIKSIVEKFHNNKALSKIYISSCRNLKSLPSVWFPNWNWGIHQQGFFNENLRVWIEGCDKLLSQVPYSKLEVHLYNCPELEALPKELRNLSSLQIFKCPNMSLSEEYLTTELTKLSIEGLRQYKVLMERGFHNFTSLIYLEIYGGQDRESFQEMDMEITLPPNLTQLRIGGFPKLKNLPFKDIEDLSSLKSLWIDYCPWLTSLPSILPSSLLQLEIRGCLSLKEACKRDKGKEWPKIAHIPCVHIDYKFIYDREE